MIVTVYELVTREDGTKGLGNSIELEVSEAIERIEWGEATSGIAPIGVVPEEWRGEG